MALASTFQHRDLISIQDLSKEEILHILDCAASLSQTPQPDLLKGKLLGSCFFEASTRTRLSFEAAMHRLGGSCIGFSDLGMTSIKKGESLHDCMKMMEQYCDLIVLRHPLEGAAQHAADVVDKPIINAGDGANQHPTQTLLDLYTIKECQGTLEGLRVAMVGDLKHGRTVHSLAQACALFGVRLYLVAPPALEMPQSICHELKTSGVKFSFHRSIEEVMARADILYMTRIQKERFQDPSEYERLKDSFELTPKQLSAAKPKLRVLHPLPRVSEIAKSVDDTPHAYYFQQARNGLFVRQALLALLLGAMS